MVCAYGIAAALYGVRSGRCEWVDSARRSVYALAVVLTVAFVVLEVAFIRNDFSYNTVADTSSRTTPRSTAPPRVWSSQEGSLLLWVWLLSIWSSLAMFLTRNRLRDIVPYATSVLLGFGAFFTTLLVFYATVRDRPARRPVEGAGLDPLLRNPSMLIHPPMLYSGYTFFTIPFAFGVGALIVRRVDADWIRAIRRFALASWLFLGIGILLGARWSYYELGWGGYWGWDAVENASLMPWLTGTAFLHSVMIQEKRGMLKVWNASLVLATGTLAIIGTFLVRCGVLNSIHAFGGATLGVPFVVADRRADRRLDLPRRHRAATCCAASTASTRCSRARRCSSPTTSCSSALCFVIFWGTFFPLISEAVTGTGSLGRAAVVRPLHGPARADPRAAQRHRPGDRLAARDARQRAAQLPRAARAALLHARRARRRRRRERPFALAMFCCAAFVLGSVGQEFFRGIARAPRDGGRAAAARAGLAGAPQPPPLRRLHRARRDRRAVHRRRRVLVLPARRRADAARRRQSTRVGAYTVRYVRPTATITPRTTARTPARR